MNAVGHRSLNPDALNDPKAATMVSIYTDVVRISNLGLLPVGRVNQYGRDRVKGRFSRNPHLMGALRRLGVAGEKGMGIATACRIAVSVGCRIEFSETNGRFQVAVVVDGNRAVDVARFGGRLHGSRRRMTAPDRAERVLDVLEDGPMSAQEVGETLGWPNTTTRAVLRGLLIQKAVSRTERSPRSPNQRYRLS